MSWSSMNGTYHYARARVCTRMNDYGSEDDPSLEHLGAEYTESSIINLFCLKGNVSLVTGSNGGIGIRIAQDLWMNAAPLWLQAAEG